MENSGKMIVDNLNNHVRQWEGSTAQSVLRKRDARAYLKVTDKTLQNWRDVGILKPYKVGGVIYYKLKDIEALFNVIEGVDHVN
jgi:hypothetical protein